MSMLVKFYQSHLENPENPPDSDKWELKCVTSVNKLKNLLVFLLNSFYSIENSS